MKNVSAAVILNDGAVLLTRRAPDEKLAGYWEFPGGKQEQGETIEECLVRELREELAIDCSVGPVFESVEYHYDGGAIRLIALYAQIKSGDITLSVHDMCEWVPFSTLLEYQLAPADIPIAKRLMDEYKQD
ncbi:(deoxy)nucleoside triphosphate pyrophosphohydrolase [Vibrio fluvialis]